MRYEQSSSSTASQTLVNGTKEKETIIYQVQSIFAFLGLSHGKFTDCLELFHRSKDNSGEPLNIMVQQDLDEFLKFFLDRIEEELRGSDCKDLIKNVFEGEVVNQVIGKSNGCTHTSERVESHLHLSLDVKNKPNVTTSLESYVAGEVLDGDNQVFFKCRT